jgi:hypothetical protein
MPTENVKSLFTRTPKPNAELSRSRWKLRLDEAGEQ